MKTGYKVSDAMTQEPISVSSDENIVNCAKLMKDHGVGALLVTDADKVIGICTEQDLVYKLVAKGIEPSSVNIKDVMCDALRTVTPDKDIFEALLMMRDMNIRHLPVVNDGKFVGLLTLKDVLKIEPQLFDLLVDTIDIKEEEEKLEKIAKAKDVDSKVDDIIEGN